MAVCRLYIEGKQHRQLSHKPATRAEDPLELIYSNLYKLIKPISFDEYIYFIFFINDYIRITYIYGLKRKSFKYILEKFKEFKAEVKNQLGKIIKRLCINGGGEYKKIIGAYLKESGIIHETTAPYSPEQNNIAEKVN